MACFAQVVLMMMMARRAERCVRGIAPVLFRSSATGVIARDVLRFGSALQIMVPMPRPKSGRLAHHFTADWPTAKHALRSDARTCTASPQSQWPPIQGEHYTG